MPDRGASPLRHPWLVVRQLRARWRLLVSFGIFAAVRAELATRLDPTTGWLLAWDGAVASYLLLAWWLVRTADVDHIRRRAAGEDEGRYVILALVATAALFSLHAIVAELGAMSASPPVVGFRLRLALTVATIFLSWSLIHTVFAFHYAHEYYAGDDDQPGGLRFEGPPPDYADFVYFSFVIGMTSQVSDVVITSPRIRRTATAHGILAFAFNAALLALMINIAASAISPGGG
jgi:uncharacterized membrane protein